MPCHTERPGCHTERPGCYTDGQQHRESIERFHQTWNALMRQLDRINSLAHLHYTQKTEGQEAVSIAKHLLGKISDQLDKAILGGM